MIPPWLMSKAVKVGAIVLVVVLVLWKAYDLGGDHVRADWEKERAQLAQAHAEEVQRLESINRKVEVRYMDRVRVVKEKGEVRVKYVPKYITKEDDSKCDISPSFVELHDSAAEGRLPDPSPSAEFDAGVAAPKLSEVGQTVVTNYNKFHEMRTQCEALQEWASSLSRGRERQVD